MGAPSPTGPSSAEHDGARSVAIDIVRRLRDAGHEALLAGGCVRDELLGLVPTDYDVATDATPDRVASLFRRTALVGAHFGVVLVKSDRAPRRGDDHVVEVATFRSDGSYSDRRRPDEVTFSDARADAQRRDFTVNALFLDPLVPGGRVVDYVDGLADLGRRVLRAVGDARLRLAEDHLRALRAVRLAARLGFTIEPATASAIARDASELRGVSAERVGDEMRRVLAHPTRARGVELLHELGLDAPMLGSARGGVATTRLGALPASTPIGACVAALALDRGDVVEARDVSTVLTRWRGTMCLSNQEREEARDVLVATLGVRSTFLGLSVAGQKRAAAREAFLWALRIVEGEDAALARRVRARVDELAQAPGGLSPEAWVTGDDLIRLGLSPGPAFAGLLTAVYDAQLEGRVASRDEALAMARELGRTGSGS